MNKHRVARRLARRPVRPVLKRKQRKAKRVTR